jgi:hypothetical protein
LNKRYKSYVRDITSLFSDKLHEEHQGLFFLHLQKLKNSLNYYSNVSCPLIRA